MGIIIGLHVFICVFLVIVILLQPGKGDAGIGFGSSSSQSIFGSKGAGNFLTKTTSVCAILFLLTSFIITRKQIQNRQGIDVTSQPALPSTTPATPVPPVDTKKVAEPGKATTTPAPTEEQLPIRRSRFLPRAGGGIGRHACLRCMCRKV